MADCLEDVVLSGVLGASLAVCASAVGVVLWFPDCVKDSYAPHVVAGFSGITALMTYFALSYKWNDEDRKS